MSIEIWKLLAVQGAGLLALAIVMIVIYRLAMHFGVPFIAAQQSLATAMQAQADCLRDLKDGLSEYISRDNNDHREILLGLQVVIREVQQLGAEMKAQGETIQRLCTEAGETRPGMARLA